tara:strand:+ start:2243 stop:3478 length:1236 start_codon:yes stop_codon:yes gene_type:complete
MQINSPINNYDIVVIGGGVVGSSFAHALSHNLQTNCPSILLVEATSPKSPSNIQPSFDSRSTAISFGSRKIYEAMNLWSTLEKSATQIHEIKVSDRGHLGSTHLKSEDLNVEALGYVIENANIGAALNEKMLASSTISFLAPAKIESIKPTPDGMELSIAKCKEKFSVAASLIVLADGGRSTICQQLGISQLKQSYRQHAVNVNVAFEKPHRNVAFERFTAAGPLAVLPLRKINNDNRCSVVWVVGEQDSNVIMELDDEEFASELQSFFGSRLGEIINIGQRFAYPLSLSISKEQIRPGLVLLGNVAHTLHPVAGQGLNLALRDISALVSTLERAILDRQALGSMKTLRSYVEKQDSDQQRSILFTDNLTKIFSSNKRANIFLRKLGLLSLEIIPTVRKSFTERAMGLITR